MNFQDKDYYKNFIDFLYKIYNSDYYKDEEREVLIRVIISRAYYTAFLHCRNYLNSTIQDFKISGNNFPERKRGIHDDVVKLLEQNQNYIAEAMTLKKLKNFRILADYTTDIELLNGTRNSLKVASGHTIYLNLNIDDIIEDVKHITSIVPK